MEAAERAYRAAERLARLGGDFLTAARAAAAIESLRRPVKARVGLIPAGLVGESGRATVERDQSGEEGAPPKFPDLVVRLRPRGGLIHEVVVNGAVSHTADLSGLALRPRSLLAVPLDGPQPEVARFGKRLTGALFVSGTVADVAWRAFRAHRQRAGPRLILELDSVEATAVPWEYASDETGRLIALDVPMIRSAGSGAGGGTPADRGGDVRVLLVESDPLLGPGDSREVPTRIPVGDESRELIDALRRTGRQYVLRRVTPPTIKALHLQLAPQALCVVHFNGHGTSDPEPLLAFEDDTGRLDPVPASDFVSRTAGQAWLVVLSACLSAAMPSGRATPLAHALAVAGVPWVIGMQDAVEVKAARTFVEVLYRYLGESHSTWEAVRQARLALADDAWSGGPAGPVRAA